MFLNSLQPSGMARAPRLPWWLPLLVRLRAEESADLRLRVVDPGRDADDGLVVGSEARLVLHSVAHQDEALCLSINGQPDVCAAARPDGGFDDLLLSGFAPGTHDIAARLGRRSARRAVDFLPAAAEAPGDKKGSMNDDAVDGARR